MLLTSVVASYAVPARWVGVVLPGHSVVDSDAVALRPGGVLDIAEGVDVDGIATFESTGELLLLTVAIDGSVSVRDWIRAVFDDATDLRSRESVYGDRSRQQQRERNQHLMENSKLTAILVALEYLGVDAARVVGVAFDSTVPGGPADGLIGHSELIVAIDGEPVTTVDSLRALLAERSAGTTATVTLQEMDTQDQRDVAVVLDEHPEESGGFLGVRGVVEQLEQRDLPFQIDISTGSVGGPSAGLALTLALIDLLTPGELTGGLKVAVTGTIRFDGTVGNVGGVHQKAAAARDAGAELLIAPASAVEEALLGAGDVRVRGVSTLDEALDVLADRGGTPPGQLEF